MPKLKDYREQQNLTQEELSELSKISVRTIQRIEAGTEPKGHTLKALAKALNTSEKDLLNKSETEKSSADINFLKETEETNAIDYSKIKFSNLSSLMFILLPPLNIFAPLILSHYQKQNNYLIKQIVSVQILWTILAPVIFFCGIFLKLGRQFTLVLIIMIALSNVFIILRNTAELDRKQKLYFKLKFNIL